MLESWQVRPSLAQQFLFSVQFPPLVVVQQVPFSQCPLQQSSPGAQELPFGRHIAVVEVVLIEDEVRSSSGR
jgi:hypothetical protein